MGSQKHDIIKTWGKVIDINGPRQAQAGIVGLVFSCDSHCPFVSTCLPTSSLWHPDRARPAGPGGTLTTTDHLAHLGFIGEPQHGEHGGQGDAHVWHELKHCRVWAEVSGSQRRRVSREDNTTAHTSSAQNRARVPLCMGWATGEGRRQGRRVGGRGGGQRPWARRAGTHVPEVQSSCPGCGD